MPHHTGIACPLQPFTVSGTVAAASAARWGVCYPSHRASPSRRGIMMPPVRLAPIRSPKSKRA
ncbi:hypothetical protein [Azospirillum doebereinerae]